MGSLQDIQKKQMISDIGHGSIFRTGRAHAPSVP